MLLTSSSLTVSEMISFDHCMTHVEQCVRVFNWQEHTGLATMQVRSEPADDGRRHGVVEQIRDELVMVHHVEGLRQVYLQKNSMARRFVAV